MEKERKLKLLEYKTILNLSNIFTLVDNNLALIFNKLSKGINKQIKDKTKNDKMKGPNSKPQMKLSNEVCSFIK